MWAALGKETRLWVKGHLQAKTSPTLPTSGRKSTSALKGYLGHVVGHPLQGSSLTQAEPARYSCIRVWNGKQRNQKWGGNFTALFGERSTNSCDPQSHLVPAFFNAYLLNGSLYLTCSCYQKNLNYFPTIPELLPIWQNIMQAAKW